MSSLDLTSKVVEITFEDIVKSHMALSQTVAMLKIEQSVMKLCITGNDPKKIEDYNAIVEKAVEEYNKKLQAEKIRKSLAI